MNSQSSNQLFRLTKANAWFYALAGVFVSIFSFNGVLKKIAGPPTDSSFNQFVNGLASIPGKLYEIVPGSKYFLFEVLVRWLFFSIVFFLLLLVFNSIRQRSAAVFASGAGGLTLGVFVFTWVSLVIYLVIIIIAVIAWIFSWIYYLLSIILSALLAFILWSPVFYGLIGLGVLFGIVFIIGNFEKLWEKLIEFLKSASFLKKLLAGTFALAVLAGAVYLIAKVWQYLQPFFEAIINWLNYYIVPVIEWILWLTGWILVIIATILAALLTIAAFVLILLILGYQYCDQFFQAKNCGRSTHKAFDAGFAMGMGVAVVFLICSTDPNYQRFVNDVWNGTMPFQTDNLITLFHTFMPSRAEALLQSLFLYPALPIFDLASLIIAFFFANSSLVMSLISGTTEEPLSQLFRPQRLPVIFLLMFGAFFVVGVAIMSSLVPEDS